MDEDVDKVKTKKEFSIPFTDIKNSILSESYELSLVFIDKKKSQDLNYRYRGKNKPTNVLSFPVSDNSGEIFIDLETAKKEAEELSKSFKEFVAYLFIHATLHLSGLDHGSTMDNKEVEVCKKFKINGQTNSSRD